jgi:hypothetical protein
VDLIPLIVALVFLGSFQEPWVAIVYMLFAGATFGAIGITRSAMWAELYGVKHLGSIKALATALMVFSSALSPPVMGIAIDAGVTMETIALASAAFCGFGLSLVIFVLPRLRQTRLCN